MTKVLTRCGFGCDVSDGAATARTWHQSGPRQLQHSRALSMLPQLVSKGPRVELWRVERQPQCHCPPFVTDATQEQSLASKYNVQGERARMTPPHTCSPPAHTVLGLHTPGFPTIKVFGLDKRNPTDYQGARQAKAIAEAGLKVCYWGCPTLARSNAATRYFADHCPPPGTGCQERCQGSLEWQEEWQQVLLLLLLQWQQEATHQLEQRRCRHHADRRQL